MGEGQFNRRGLLGLLAAAPFGAVVRPAKAALQLKIGTTLDKAAIRRTMDGINEMLAIHKGEKIDIWTPNECRAVLHGDNVKDYNSLSNCQDHPPRGLSHPKADDEGPGAPDPKCGGCPPADFAKPLRGGAPVPDPLRQSKTVAALILHHARAC